MGKYLNNTKREFQRCVNCVMDTTDSKIVFDENGVCDFCNDYKTNILPHWNPSDDNPELEIVSEKIRKAGKGKKYDCIIGLSGGVDSSYLCYIAKTIMKLRPLVFVVDTGWNLNVAVKNIEKVVKKLNLDIYTEVVNWDEMKDLQLAFFKSQVPYQDLPQDHAIFAALYNYAVKNGIKYVLTGANNATECIRPPVEWVYQNDITLIKDIHKKFGKIKLKTFPLCGMIKYRLFYPYIKGMRRVAPLNLIDFDYDKVKAFLQEYFGWQSYENKHYENIFTRFYEGYYLPYKFGYDKRKCYLTNMILTGGMTRDEALKELETSPYSFDLIQEDKEYIAKRLGISTDEFETLINGENKTFEDYKNSFKIIQFGTRVLRSLSIEKKKFR
ncbi:MAG: N-acetyl sugar amidotransferase [Eubacteriales bacterium]|nr:N-acetyl sugar amidotransferase [Eubacteriales bacterium]